MTTEETKKNPLTALSDANLAKSHDKAVQTRARLLAKLQKAKQDDKPAIAEACADLAFDIDAYATEILRRKGEKAAESQAEMKARAVEILKAEAAKGAAIDPMDYAASLVMAKGQPEAKKRRMPIVDEPKKPVLTPSNALPVAPLPKTPELPASWKPDGSAPVDVGLLRVALMAWPDYEETSVHGDVVVSVTPEAVTFATPPSGCGITFSHTQRFEKPLPGVKWACMVELAGLRKATNGGKGEVKLSLKERLLVARKTGSMGLVTRPAEKLPDPAVNDTGLGMEEAVLERAFAHALAATSTDPTRFAICQKVNVGPGAISATDGHRLHTTPLSGFENMGSGDSFHEWLAEGYCAVVQHLTGSSGKVNVKAKPTGFGWRVESPFVEFSAYVPNSETAFPEWGAVVPKHTLGSVRVKAGVLRAALEAVKPVWASYAEIVKDSLKRAKAEKKREAVKTAEKRVSEVKYDSKSVVLSATAGGLVVSVDTPDKQSARQEVKGVTDLKTGVRACVNGEYLADTMLMAADDEDVVVRFHDGDKACVTVLVGQTTPLGLISQGVVMPMRGQGVNGVEGPAPVAPAKNVKPAKPKTSRKQAKAA